MSTPKIGTVGWMDLTVGDADGVRDFYANVVGWKPEPVAMGGYNDYCMGPPGADPVAGVCHARGVNAGLPPCWLIYINVDDVDRAAAEVTNRGGKVIVPVKKMGAYGRYCVIQDPAGAHCALFEPTAPA